MLRVLWVDLSVRGQVDEAIALQLALGNQFVETLLAQIDTDNRAGMMWGDCGALYWLTRRDDLARGEYTNTAFTWQCS